ncbi:MAG: hypothetical protein JSR96_07650 [Proteobacteria bacterium]|nr:hypothetical protein [Pseudomonadota bacterium]
MSGLRQLAGRQPVLWAAVFGAGMALIAWLEHHHLIVRPWNLVLIALFSVSLWPLALAAANRAAAQGTNTPAMRAYHRRTIIWSLGYLVAISIALTVRNTFDPVGPVLWAIAVLPSLPIFYFIWTMGRYLVEESDEYQRMRMARAGLIATGILLTVATFLGFLETFGVAPHVDAGFAVPVWAAGLGLGQCLNRQTGSDGDEA